MADKIPLDVKVNGTEMRATVEPRLSLLDFLRDELGLTGTRAGCEHGVCGACTVLVGGEAVRACLMLAVQANGLSLETIEGEAEGPGELSVLQEAFCQCHGLQCGYCTSGMILTARALLNRNPTPDRDEIVAAIAGNLCRCTGYLQIVEAIELAASELTQARRTDGSRR